MIETLLALFVQAVGFSTSVQSGDTCHDALHAFRTEHRLKVLASEQVVFDIVGSNIQGVVYTLGDGPFRPSRSAVLICGPNLSVAA